MDHLADNLKEGQFSQLLAQHTADSISRIWTIAFFKSAISLTGPGANILDVKYAAHYTVVDIVFCGPRRETNHV